VDPDEKQDHHLRRVEILDRRRLFDDFFRIEEATLRYERFDGGLSEPVRRLALDRGDSVAAIIVRLPERRILLVDQFKYPVYTNGTGWILETVAGMVDKNESYEQAVRREVREEIGYELLALEHIATFYVSPGGSSERIALFYGEVSEATRVSVGGGLASEGEDIALREFAPEELWAALDAGGIDDAKTLIGVMWLREKLRGSP
jgi:nudix-type nucleoside diphosphatase (YffH/AdpP family)